MTRDDLDRRLERLESRTDTDDDADADADEPDVDILEIEFDDTDEDGDDPEYIVDPTFLEIEPVAPVTPLNRRGGER